MGCVHGVAIVVVEVLWQALSALREVLRRPPEEPVNLGLRMQRTGEREKEMIEEARKEIGIDCVKHYNFAVSGASGTGKSSFINAVRLIPDNHPEAAKVGVTETTENVKYYKHTHPDMKQAFLWDLPGAGTEAHPTDTYFETMKLYTFDCIFILSSDRFLEVDMQIAKYALDYQKPIALVRTKADVAIKNLCQCNGITAEEASRMLRSQVSESFKQNLQIAGLSNHVDKIPLFIISNKLFTRPKAYCIYDPENETLDNSLKKMDEDQIYNFMKTSVETRFRP